MAMTGSVTGCENVSVAAAPPDTSSMPGPGGGSATVPLVNVETGRKSSAPVVVCEPASGPLYTTWIAPEGGESVPVSAAASTSSQSAQYTHEAASGGPASDAQAGGTETSTVADAVILAVVSSPSERRTSRRRRAATARASRSRGAGSTPSSWRRA